MRVSGLVNWDASLTGLLVVSTYIAQSTDSLLYVVEAGLSYGNVGCTRGLCVIEIDRLIGTTFREKLALKHMRVNGHGKTFLYSERFFTDAAKAFVVLVSCRMPRNKRSDGLVSDTEARG